MDEGENNESACKKRKSNDVQKDDEDMSNHEISNCESAMETDVLKQKSAEVDQEDKLFNASCSSTDNFSFNEACCSLEKNANDCDDNHLEEEPSTSTRVKKLLERVDSHSIFNNVRSSTRHYRNSNTQSLSSTSSSSNADHISEGTTERHSPVVSPGGTNASSLMENISNLDPLIPLETESNSPEANEQLPLSDSPARDNSIMEASSPLNNQNEAMQLESSSDSSEEHSSIIQIDAFSEDDNLLDDDDYRDEDDNDFDTPSNATSEDESASTSADAEVNEVMDKPLPAYRWNFLNQIINREHGFLGGVGLSGTSRFKGKQTLFENEFYASRHVVERMELSSCLRKHKGCVNCLHFNRSGNLLCSGSDDTRIVVWDWARNKTKHVFKSGHTENIFQTKFVDSIGCLDIVSASRDGQVRRSVILPSGGEPIPTTCLYKHRGPVHKLVIVPQSTSELISVGEDGYIKHKDLRSDVSASNMVKVVSKNSNSSKKASKVRLYSIAHHPFAPEICVCGCDNFVRVYDKRNMKETVHEMCPKQLLELAAMPTVTSSVYNTTGTEILASYTDDHIYLFNNKNYTHGDYLHRYRGRHNHRTIKGVNFFGPNSEYVISGSDCGNIFFWDKNTEAIVNVMPGDSMGVVNCLEPHPQIPVLATSGLDHSIKIWTPTRKAYPPDMTKVKTCVKRNLRRSVIDEYNDFDDRQFHAFLRQFLRNPRRRSGRNVNRDSDDDDDDDNSNISFPHDSSVSSTEDDDDDDDDNDYSQFRTTCRNQ